MGQRGGFKNLKLGKNVYRQMKRRGRPDRPPVRTQPPGSGKRTPPGSRGESDKA